MVAVYRSGPNFSAEFVALFERFLPAPISEEILENKYIIVEDF
jgi:hypothetical protein